MGTCWNCGGVGALEFNQLGWVIGYQRIANNNQLGWVIGYQRIANNLRKNCGGGPTPWNSWVTCEEVNDIENNYTGRVWQTDPTGLQLPVVTAFGELGSYESFAYDTSTTVPTFYVSRDAEFGVLTRFTPNTEGMECYNKEGDYERWCTLNHGDVDYLLISGPSEVGTFTWIKNETEARTNANMYYRNAEGIDAADGKVFFVSKEYKRLVILDLAKQAYVYSSTASGAFADQPDQVGMLVNGNESALYFCEDGGPTSGVFGRAADGRYFTLLEGRTDGNVDESTGLSWSPDSKTLFVTYQQGGFVYACTRDDQLPFYRTTLDIKYHAI